MATQVPGQFVHDWSQSFSRIYPTGLLASFRSFGGCYIITRHDHSLKVLMGGTCQHANLFRGDVNEGRKDADSGHRKCMQKDGWMDRKTKSVLISRSQGDDPLHRRLDGLSDLQQHIGELFQRRGHHRGAVLGDWGCRHHQGDHGNSGKDVELHGLEGLSERQSA